MLPCVIDSWPFCSKSLASISAFLLHFVSSAARIGQNEENRESESVPVGRGPGFSMKPILVRSAAIKGKAFVLVDVFGKRWSGGGVCVWGRALVGLTAAFMTFPSMTLNGKYFSM